MEQDERKTGQRRFRSRRPQGNRDSRGSDHNSRAENNGGQEKSPFEELIPAPQGDRKKFTFQELGIREDIIKSLEAKGYQHPTPIQAQTIPVILQGRDVIGQAETGSGKTAACAIPAIQTLDMSLADVQVLVLTPTRELAIQYLTEITSIGGPLGVLPFVVYGGFDKSIQQVKIRAGVHILVATPGRLIDLIYNGTLELENVKLLIVDEADEMLDMGFLDDVKFIKKCLIHEHQTLLFSATMPPPIKALAGKYLTDPLHIKLNRDQVTPQSLKHCYVEVEEDNKADRLIELVKDQDISQAIIFCNTRQKVSRVYRDLKRRLPDVTYLHGGLEQRVRTHTMEMIRMGELRFVVTTDVMARGIDVKNLSHIIHFDLPRDPEVYIHRSGRTGRQGKEGVAIAFVTHRERKLFGRMMVRASAEAHLIGVADQPKPREHSRGGSAQAGERPSGQREDRSRNSRNRRSQGRRDDRADQRPETDRQSISQDRSADRPSNRPLDRPVERAAEKVAEKVVEKIVERPSSQPKLQLRSADSDQPQVKAPAELKTRSRSRGRSQTRPQTRTQTESAPEPQAPAQVIPPPPPGGKSLAESLAGLERSTRPRRTAQPQPEAPAAPQPSVAATDEPAKKPTRARRPRTTRKQDPEGPEKNKTEE